MTKRMHLILPMAGHGQRFRDAGYAEEKPLIEVGGKTLLAHALSPLDLDAWDITVVTRFDQPKAGLLNEMHRLDPDHAHTWVELPGSTPGAACTVLAAAVALPPDDSVLVANCDQWFSLPPRTAPTLPGPPMAGDGDLPGLAWVTRPGLAGVLGEADWNGWDGFILTFPGTGPQWSYAVVNGPGGDRVLHVIEKAEVSPHATVGVYWWRRAGDLVKSICGMIAADQRTKGEFYLAPAFNFLPLSSKDVRIVPVKEFVGLGTPEQVKAAEDAATFREV